MNTQSGQSHRAVQFGVLGLLGGIVLAVVVRFIIIADAPTIPRDPEPVLQPAPTDPTAWALASPVFKTGPVKPSSLVLPPPPVIPGPPDPPASPVAPQLDRNSQAYRLLMQGISSKRLSVLKDDADKAYSASADPALRYITDWFSRLATVVQQCGLETLEFDETSTLSAAIRFVVMVHLNPDVASDIAIKFAALIAQVKLGDFDKNRASIDATYPPRIAVYNERFQRYQQDMQEYPLVVQRNTQQYEATVQRIKYQHDTDVEQTKQKYNADVERYQQEMQQYEAAVRRTKEEHDAAVQRYPQQLEEYNAALQQYPIKHQAWQQDVERREKQATEATRRTANMWFWIVLIAMPVTSALYGGTIAVTEIVSVHVESTPAGAEIFVDGDFVGYSPVDFQIAKGKHVLCIDKQDYQRWERSISAVDGMKLAPTLEKATTPSTLTTTRQEAVKPSHAQGQSRKWALRGLLIIVVCAVGLLGVSIIVDHLTAGSMWFLIYWRSFGISW